MVDYMAIIVEFYPGLEVNCRGPRDDYNNLIFLGAVIPKDELDSHSLTHLKRTRNREIDVRTTEIISDGFQYGGRTFSLSVYAQLNWSELGNNYTLYAYPYTVPTKDDEEYVLVSTADAEAFYAASVNSKNSALQAGRILKTQIGNTQDEAELNLITDNR